MLASECSGDRVNTADMKILTFGKRYFMLLAHCIKYNIIALTPGLQNTY